MAPIPKAYSDQKMQTLILSRPAPNVLLIEINRPEAFNAFNNQQHAEMRQAIDMYAADDSLWCCIITGSGRGFCAGQDLKEVLDAGAVNLPPGGLGGITHRQGTMKPLIAAVNGLALGGGFELALACDIIIASEKAVFGLPEVKVGLAALGGGAQNLSKIVGYQTAMYYAMTAMQIPAAKALALGIAQEVVKHDDLMKRALEVAEMIAGNSPDGVRATKAMGKLGLEKGWIETNVGTDDLPEVQAMFKSQNMKIGTTAFSAKKTPKWVGYQKL